MAYDESIVLRIRTALAGDPTASGKKTVGGVAFLLDGLVSVGVSGTTPMARVGGNDHADSLKRKHVHERDITGRPMQGHVFVDAAGIGSPAQFHPWLQRCKQLAATRPPKAPE